MVRPAAAIVFLTRHRLILKGKKSRADRREVHFTLDLAERFALQELKCADQKNSKKIKPFALKGFKLASSVFAGPVPRQARRTGHGGTGFAAVAGAPSLPDRLKQTKQAYDVQLRDFGSCSL
jgi:protein-disulfide isomerase